MKIVKKDSDIKKQEEAQKAALLKEEATKEKYLEGLRKSQAFQKYVVEGIFAEEIRKLTDIRNIPDGDYESMGKIVLQAKATRAVIEKIISQLR